MDGPWIGIGVLELGDRHIEGARYHIAAEPNPHRPGRRRLKGRVALPPGSLRSPGETVVINNSPMGASDTLILDTGERISIVLTGISPDGSIEFLVSGGMPGMEVF